jgi:hypothetical protein
MLLGRQSKKLSKTKQVKEQEIEVNCSISKVTIRLIGKFWLFDIDVYGEGLYVS